MAIKEDWKVSIFVVLVWIFAGAQIVLGSASYQFKSHGHGVHKDHVAFLGVDAAREFEGLTQKESVRRLRMLVPRIDINKDGFVDESELTIWIRHKLQKWTEHEDIDAIYHDLDANYDNKVTWDEYMMRTFGFYEKDKDKKWDRENLIKYIEEDRLKWKFADKNNDTFLNREEYEYFHHPREHEAMSEYIAVIEMTEHDKDGDGFLSRSEYLDSLNAPAFAALDTKNFNEKLDFNHDGKLDLVEVEQWKKPRNYDKAAEQAEHLIEYADDDKDGRLTIDEVANNHHIFVGSYGTRFGQVLHDEF